METLFAIFIFLILGFSVIATVVEIHNKPNCPQCGASGNSTYRRTEYWIMDDWGCGHCGWSWKESKND